MANTYKVIDLDNYPKKKQFDWFNTFLDPTYGFNVKMDITSVVKYSKRTGTSFFLNMLYAVTKGLSSVPEMRIRFVKNEARLYDNINPAFTVLNKVGIYENAGFDMIEDYEGFYKKGKEVVEEVKSRDYVKESFNDSNEFDEYYITCVPWVSYEGMRHPTPSGNRESLTVPRVCWDKFREENGRFYLTLNITVSHTFVDGKPLCDAFNKIQDNLTNFENFINN